MAATPASATWESSKKSRSRKATYLRAHNPEKPHRQLAEARTTSPNTPSADTLMLSPPRNGKKIYRPQAASRPIQFTRCSCRTWPFSSLLPGRKGYPRLGGRWVFRGNWVFRRRWVLDGGLFGDYPGVGITG